MKVVSMPTADTKMEDRVKEASERMLGLFNENKISAYVFVGVDADGAVISNGLGMLPQDMALASMIIQDMARSVLFEQSKVERK